MSDNSRLKKLKWLCRRGMKELDVLLDAFVRKNSDNLMSGEWPELETLLSQEDDVLWYWIQNPDHSAASDYQSLLNRIRDDASTSP